MVDFMEKFEKIYRILYLIKDNLKGFKIFFDVDNKISRVLILGFIFSGVGFFVSVVLYCIVMVFVVFFIVVIVGVLIGLVMVGFEMLEVVDDFDIVCINVFKVRVKVFIVDEIKCNLREVYFERIKIIIEIFLEGDLK